MTAIATATNSFACFLDRAKGRVQWRSNVWIVGLLVIVIAFITTSLSYTARADREIDRQFQSKLALYREQAGRIEQLERVKGQGTDLSAQAAFDASLIDAVPRSRALAEISGAVSPGIRLVGISLATETTKTAISAARLIHIRGVASSDAKAGQFVATLGKSPLFQNVKLISAVANSADGKEPENFEAEAIFGNEVGSSAVHL